MESCTDGSFAAPPKTLEKSLATPLPNNAAPAPSNADAAAGPKRNKAIQCQLLRAHSFTMGAITSASLPNSTPKSLEMAGPKTSQPLDIASPIGLKRLPAASLAPVTLGLSDVNASLKSFITLPIDFISHSITSPNIVFIAPKNSPKPSRSPPPAPLLESKKSKKSFFRSFINSLNEYFPVFILSKNLPTRPMILSKSAPNFPASNNSVKLAIIFCIPGNLSNTIAENLAPDLANTSVTPLIFENKFCTAGNDLKPLSIPDLNASQKLFGLSPPPPPSLKTRSIPSASFSIA